MSQALVQQIFLDPPSSAELEGSNGVRVFHSAGLDRMGILALLTEVDP
jgi:hypothetical protein